MYKSVNPGPMVVFGVGKFCSEYFLVQPLCGTNIFLSEIKAIVYGIFPSLVIFRIERKTLL